MKQNRELRIDARTASLHADAGGADAGGTFGGLAVAAGDVLHMDDGTPVLFTAEELKRAASSQAGEPLTADHPRDENGKPAYPPPTDETVGTVAEAGYVRDGEMEGVAYEATTHDPNIARGVQAGTYDVSVHPTFDLGEEDPETGAHIARNVEFRDLSVVSKGDSPNNTAEWGANQQLAAWASDGGASGESLLAQASAESAGSGTSEPSGTLGGGDDGSVSTESLWSKLGDRLGITTDGGARGSGIKTETEQNEKTEQTEQTEQNAKNEEGEKSGDEPAESGEDDSDTDSMATNPPEEEPPEEGDTPEEEEGEEETSGQTMEMEVPEEYDSVEEYLGAIIDKRVEKKMEATASEQQKAEKVDEIIGAADEYDADDRDALMASADALVDKEHQRVSGGGARLTASTGRGVSRQDSAADDLDAYGTGVQGEDN